MFEHVAILGAGLLGSSLGQALHERGLARRITVWARRPETRLALQNEHRWCSEAYAQPGETVSGADLIVACTPVEHIVELLRTIAPAVKKGALVTDVGSVKSLICRTARDVFPTGIYFVGSHPMAGSEKSGLAHAQPDLYQDRVGLVTPLIDTPPAAVEKVVALWQAVGMRVTTLSPEEHDEIVAHISHLPHFLATVLCSYLASKPARWPAFSGGGLRDTTRVAAGHPVMWREILQQNREEILRALRGFQDELEAFHATVANEDFFQAAHFLERGKRFRDQL